MVKHLFWYIAGKILGKPFRETDYWMDSVK